MKRFFEDLKDLFVVMWILLTDKDLFAAMWILLTDSEEARQYDYDNGGGEID